MHLFLCQRFLQKIELYTRFEKKKSCKRDRNLSFRKRYLHHFSKKNLLKKRHVVLI